MRARSLLLLSRSLLLFVCVLSADPTQCPERFKIAVFNFSVHDLDAKDYDTTITDTRITLLERAPSLLIINRREPEAFLLLEDFERILRQREGQDSLPLPCFVF